MDAKLIAALMEQEAEIRPVIKKGLEIIKSYGPDLKDLFGGVTEAMADLRINVIRKYEAAGFTREEAILLTMDEWFAMARVSRSMNTKNKK